MSHTPSRKLQCSAIMSLPQRSSSREKILNPTNRCTTSGTPHALAGRVLCWLHGKRFNEGKPVTFAADSANAVRLLFPDQNIDLAPIAEAK